MKIVAALAGLLLTMGAAAPAEDAWTPTVKCATGAFTDFWPGEDDLGHPTTWVSGWITPCDRPAPDDQYGVIYYVDDDKGTITGYVHLARLRAYDEASRSTAFAGVVDPDVRRFGTLVGICVAYDDGAPVGCFQPWFSSGTRPEPPPVDVLAKAPVTQIVRGNSTNPSCGSCL